MNIYLPAFLGFLGALLTGVALWRDRLGGPGAYALGAVGSLLLVFVTLVYLLALLGVGVFA